MPKSRDLSEELSKKLDDPNLPPDYTVSDFFDEMSIPCSQRSDFAFAAILNGVMDKWRTTK